MDLKNMRWLGIAVLGMAILGATAFPIGCRSAAGEGGTAATETPTAVPSQRQEQPGVITPQATPEGEPQVLVTLHLIFLTMDEMVKKSSIIVIGRVKEFLPSRWNTDDVVMIYTDMIFEIEQVVKDEIGLVGNEVTVRLLGGTVGQTTVRVLEEAEFQVGERALVFLDTDNKLWTQGDPEHYRMMGYERGKWQILDDGTVVNPLQRDSKYYPQRTLSELLAAINAALTPTAQPTSTPMSLQPTPTLSPGS